ncbi:MAG: topoisomerase IV, partial [Firmicutes bacterium]|nr:topoisomerase IV [Bacillota bacterium]
MHKCHKGIINYAGEEKKEKISDVIESNYMPYAMSVIMSRAIPEIDGFKPSQRKLLFTMYKMGLLHSPRTKSANIVGQTMKLNPHGDSAIYDTMARMSRGYEALPYPYVDSKGNFGKCYSRDMARAASRYTEAKLENICEEIFKDIEKNTVDFVFNYDNTLKEPTLFPVAYPSILVNSISGIAVGMASSICPFNLKEICETVIKLIKNKDHDIVSTLIAPDFTCGAEVIYDKDIIEEIYKTGRGTIQFRARYLIDSNLNCIDIINIPPTTTCESIIEKVADLIKQNKITEISDIRDETGLNGLKITIDLKKGTDFDRLMFKLFKLTTLQDNFSCNFNILVNGTPRVMSVHQIIFEWIDFRIKSIKRRLTFELGKKEEKLEVLVGLEKILLDVDIAIKIIRETKEESSVVSNLMNHFNLSKIQSEFISELKLKNLNKEYIFKKINEIKNIKDEILKFKKILENESRLKKIICKELEFISKKFGKDRICPIIYKEDIDKKEAKIEYVQDYPITLFFTKEGYIKKISQHSVKLNNDQKLKVG